MNERFSYLGFNEFNEQAGIVFIIKAHNNVFIIINKDNNKIISFSNDLYEKNGLIKKITNIIKDTEKQTINLTISKRKESFYVKYYPVSLSYLNEQYILSIQLPDSTFRFVIHNIEELLSSLKEGMIFPGDKFVGLEAIELLDKRKGIYYWKAKCLLCGRITKVTQRWLLSQKSCGCLNNYHLSDEERFLSYINKQENVLKEKQIRGTLGIDEEPCWLWGGAKDERGYGFISITGKQKRTNRYALELKLGRNLLPGMYSLHRCDNPSCVNPDHLFEGTHAENMQDMIKKGRNNKIFKIFGEKHPLSKLTKKQVLEIRNNKNKTQKEMSNKYGVNQSIICRIISGKRRVRG